MFSLNFHKFRQYVKKTLWRLKGFCKIEHLLHKKIENIQELRKILDVVREQADIFRETQLRATVELGRTLNVIRGELLLIYDRPLGANGSRPPGNSDPAILRDYVDGSRMKEIHATDLFPDLEKVWMPVGAVHEETQHPNQVDLLYVVAFAKARNAKRIFEFGTYQGRTTYHLSLASEDAHVTTINLSPEDDPSVAEFLGVMFKGSDREQYITQILSDSRALDTQPFAHSMDYIFIDGDHSYELVKNDTEKAIEMLAPGGMIIWHDYAAKSPGVVRYIKEFSQSRPVFRINDTCLVLFIDGIDPMSFVPPKRRKSWISKP